MKLSQQLICYFIFRRLLPGHTKDKKLGDVTTDDDDDDDEVPPWLRTFVEDTEQAGPDATAAGGAEQAGPDAGVSKMKDAEVQTTIEPPPPLR